MSTGSGQSGALHGWLDSQLHNVNPAALPEANPQPHGEAPNVYDDDDAGSLLSHLKDPADQSEGADDGSLRSSLKDPADNEEAAAGNAVPGPVRRSLRDAGPLPGSQDHPGWEVPSDVPGHVAQHHADALDPPSETSHPEDARVFPAIRTFGVELEFVLLVERPPDFLKTVLAEAAASGWPEGLCRTIVETRLADIERVKLVDALRQRGVPCNDYITNIHTNPYDANKWAIETDGSVEVSDEFYEPVLTLANGRRIEMSDELRKQTIVAAVEVKSRILMTATNDSIAEIRAVVDVIRQTPSYCNVTTGLHCHVGQGPEGFDLRTLKNLIMTGALFEEQMSQLHPADRISNSYCAPPSECFEPKDQSPRAMFERIESFTSAKELIRWWHVHLDDRHLAEADPTATVCLEGWHAYNLLNLQGGRRKQTVEFRGAAGSLDPYAVVRWVLFTTGFMTWAQQRGKPYASIYEKARFIQNYGILDLLRDMGLPGLAAMYEGHTFIHQR